MAAYKLFRVLVCVLLFATASLELAAQERDSVKLATMAEEEQLLEWVTSLDPKVVNQIDAMLDTLIGRSDSTDFLAFATIYHMGGNYEWAISKIDAELALNPTNTEAMHLKGLCFLDQGRFEKALHWFGRAAEYGLEDGVLYYNRGQAHRQLKQYSEAETNYQYYLLTDSTDADAWNNLGLCQISLYKFESAIKSFNHALRHGDNDARHYRNRGRCYLYLDKPERAVQDFSKVLAIQPEHPRTMAFMAVAMHLNGQYDEGCKTMKKAIDLGFSDSEWYNMNC